MTRPNSLSIIAIGLAVMAWGGRACAEGDVTIVAAPKAVADASTQSAVNPDGTPVVHKSLHKKKKTTASSSASIVAKTPSTVTPSTSASVTSSVPISPIVKPYIPPVSHISALPQVGGPGAGPAVETGLPVARHLGADGLSGVSSMPLSPGTTISQTGLQSPSANYQKLVTGSLSPVSPLASIPTSTMVGSYSSRDRVSSPSGDFVFTNFSRKTKNTYPWKTGIFTTKFWIGEGGSAISSTTNIGSAWDENWRSSNRGTDNPDDRSGYAPADHAPTVNPFYVALPFNDLAYPDEARRWLPAGWYRKPKDGKQVSACKDRWVEIKNAGGRICYAQWEDVGPLVSDHAEYVFGSERPDTLTRAGLDVSPAVAQYLGFADSGITSWRFVDDEDVPPGAWLKYDELALIYTALHNQKNSRINTSLPIQQAAEPIDDPSTEDTNKKKVGAAKG